MIRHGAKLVHAFAEAEVTTVTVILRKAFGGAFIAMNSKDLGADFVYAWPSAQLGVMGPKQAVDIIHRREIGAHAEPERHRDTLAAAYGAEHMHPAAATADGFIDEVIPPSETRGADHLGVRQHGERDPHAAAGWEHPALNTIRRLVPSPVSSLRLQ